jgi:hypothetical protein
MKQTPGYRGQSQVLYPGSADILRSMGVQPGGQPSPQTHSFSLSAWQRANPQGDANAAKADAQQKGYQVVQ